MWGWKCEEAVVSGQWLVDDARRHSESGNLLRVEAHPPERAGRWTFNLRTGKLESGH